MPNPFGMAQGMAGQMQPPPIPPQGNNPWPSPMDGLGFLRDMIQPPPMNLNAFNDQGQFSLSGALGGAAEMGGQLFGMADVPAGKLGGMAGRMINRGGDDLARAMGGFGDNASGTIRGNLPPVRGLDPGNLGAMDEMAPLGGGAPPMDMPNQAWNDSLPDSNPMRDQLTPEELAYQYPVGPGGVDGAQFNQSPMYPDERGIAPWYGENNVGPQPMSSADNLQDFDRWSSADLGPDDFATRDDWMRHQDYMQQGPTPGPMNFVASSGDPQMLIQQAALDMIQQGVSPAEAIQAATMQFSDLLP